MSAALRSQRQVEFEVSLDYTVRSRAAKNSASKEGKTENKNPE